MKTTLKSLISPWNLLVIGILLLAFFVRVYRQTELLGFYYDQGRDALVIWDLWHKAKPFLIGPVTGLPGIFLGPFYYYLIAPFYLLGGGDPLYPAIFLAFLTVAAIYFLYRLGESMHSKFAGLIAAAIAGFSYQIVYNSRWLSNPIPIYLTSVLLLWSLWEIVKGGNKYWWIVSFLLAGVSLHFESASAVFYVPILVAFTIWQRKKFPGIKIFGLSLLAFGATLLPQIIFNFRHENILFNNFQKLFVEERGFQFTKFLLEERTKFFWEVLTNKLITGWYFYSAIFFILVVLALVFGRKNLKKGLPGLFGIFFLIPVLGYYSFRGNHGVVYDYYLSGYYLPFILLFSIGLAELAKNKRGTIAVFVFFLIFLVRNLTIIHGHISQSGEGPDTIAFKNQLRAVDWVFEDARGRGSFNVDVYVPPVIPYSYDYLFLWQGTKRCGDSLCGQDKQGLQPVLYTLFEQDPPHPERLQAWMDRQKGIGEVEEEERFAGITVQRRRRL